MLEIQDILNERFNNFIDVVLANYKKKIKGMIAHYAEFDEDKREILKLINQKEIVGSTDLEKLPIEIPRLKELMRDMVKNNILYFNPTEAVYYPQGKGYHWGIRLFIESLT